jgi:hypothetical protein
VPFAFAGLNTWRNLMNFLRAFLNRRAGHPARPGAGVPRSGRRPTAIGWLPRAILRLLLDPRRRQELLAIITAIEALSHLSPEERRALAVRALAAWLQAHHIPLDEHEINLLVELLVHLVKK